MKDHKVVAHDFFYKVAFYRFSISRLELKFLDFLSTFATVVSLRVRAHTPRVRDRDRDFFTEM